MSDSVHDLAWSGLGTKPVKFANKGAMKILILIKNCLDCSTNDSLKKKSGLRRCLYLPIHGSGYDSE